MSDLYIGLRVHSAAFSHQIGAVDAYGPIGATNPIQHFGWVKYNGARPWNILRREASVWRRRQACVHAHSGEDIRV